MRRAGAFRDNLSGGTTEGAYRQTYAHDEWDNLTSRVGRVWSAFDSFTQTLTSRNQNPLYQYDAAGHLLQDETRTYRWDAAGRMVYAQDVTDATRHLTQDYDGDGRRVKRVGLNALGQMETTFYVTSSVLGGRTVAETTSQGETLTRYAYLGGEVIAEYGAGAATWMHRDPVTGSRRGSGVEGNAYGVVELDPEGVDVGQYDPFMYGEGMIGMTWAFFIAGCPAAVASQWNVESRSTSRLMVEFHRNLSRSSSRGATAKADALRQASLRLLASDEFNHPFYWAGFVLVGDPR